MSLRKSERKKGGIEGKNGRDNSKGRKGEGGEEGVPEGDGSREGKERGMSGGGRVKVKE